MAPEPDAVQVAPRTVEELIRARLLEAIGGLRGSIEVGLPLLGYVVAWSITSNLRLSFGIAVAICVVAAALRLAQRQTLRHVFTGIVGVAIAALFVRLTGRAEGAFLPSVLKNVGLTVLYAVSNLVRWPALGFLVGIADPDFDKDPVAWRRHAGMVRVCQRLTWVLVALFAIRAAVLAPLYLAGQVTALGIASVALGWPLWAAALAVMGAMLSRGSTPYDEEPEPRSPA